MEDYERQQEKLHKGITKTKGFRYPPILPIVYYTGTDKWTVPQGVKDRIALCDAFEEYIPNYQYHLVNTSTNDVLDVIAKVVSAIMRKQNIPENEIQDFVDQIKERHMGDLFEGWKGFDVQEERRIGKEQGREEGKEILLVENVCKKLKKGQNVATIAEALEETEDRIRNIVCVAEKYAPDYNVEKIIADLNSVSV